MGYFIILIAIGLISYGVGAGFRAAWFKRNSLPAEGVVVENELSGISRRAYYPVVEYKAANGRKHKFRSDFGSRPAAYKVGDPVPIRYLPKRPDRGRIEKAWQIWWNCIGLTGLGLVAMVVGMRLIGII